MKNKSTYSIQDWLPFSDILESGEIILKDHSMIKIIKIFPINFNLKSELEKEAILNSYHLFLKTCNFDIQILIQTSKENLTKHISKIQEIKNNKNNQNLQEIFDNYINFIQNKNQEKTSSSKNFYILIKTSLLKENTKIMVDNLNEKFYKIKECLAHCGNAVTCVASKAETIEILYSFYNYRKYVKE